MTRIIFITSLGIIAFIIGFRMLAALTPLEYSSPYAEKVVNTTTGICIPLAIVITLTGTLRDNESFFTGIGKVALTIFVALFSLVIIVFTSLDFCGWSDRNTLFYNKRSPRNLIIIREYGCGVFDSYLSKEVLLVKPFLPGLNWTTEIDTMKIDHTEWTRP